MRAIARMRHERRNADGDDSGVDGARHPPVAIQTRGAREFLEPEDREQRDPDDRRDAAGEDRRQAHRREHEPRAIGAPNRPEILFESPVQNPQHDPSHEQGDEDDAQIGEKNRIVQRVVRGHQ